MSLVCEAAELSVPGLVLSLELEVSFEAGCLLQHLRLGAVDQSGLKFAVSVLLLLLLLVLWFQQLGEVSFQLQQLDWNLVPPLQLHRLEVEPYSCPIAAAERSSWS